MNADKPDYDAAYFTATYGTEEPRPFSAHWWPVRWYAALADRCLRQINGQRLLEIGCGQGFMLARLERRYDTWGVDVSDFAIRESRRIAHRSRCLVADVEKELPAEVTSQAFDLVLAKYVFEHLQDPLTVLRRIFRLLRPGGLLLFSVPYTESFGARRKGAEWFANKDPTHCSLLPRSEWLQLVEDAKFMLEWESADGWWDVPYLERVPERLQLPLFIGPTALACLSGRALLPPKWGENILILARRPRGKAA